MANLLVITIFLPIVGIAAVWFVASGGREAVRASALGTTLLTLALALVLIVNYQKSAPHDEPFAATSYAWLSSGADPPAEADSSRGVDIRFATSLDGISVWMFGLSALLMVTSVLVSWEAIDHDEPLFYSMLLLLECGCLGVFTAQDIILFYVFFEFTLIPLFFLIGVWGSEQRRYAAVKFFLFTLAGSVLTFLGLLTLVFWASGRIGMAGKLTINAPTQLTFSIPELTERLSTQYDRMMASTDGSRDGNPDGAIDLSDAPYQSQVDRGYRQLAFSLLDDDHNNLIGWRELSNPSVNAPADPSELYLALRFSHGDSNNDGGLSYTELKSLLGEIDDESTLTRLQELRFYGEPTVVKTTGTPPETATSDVPADSDENTPTPVSPEMNEQASEEASPPAEGADSRSGIPPSDWKLSWAAFAQVTPQRWEEINSWQASPDDFYTVPTNKMQESGGWKFTRQQIEDADFRLGLMVFLALFIGFAIKVPLFPLHTWLPLAHVQAPTAGSVILAGILLKIGVYGFLRFNIPMLPTATAVCAPWLLGLAVAGVIYGALVALAQSDIKKLIAYSSVSHLGYCMLGLFALNNLGVQGAVLQMVNHGISTGALFALVGMLYERYHTRQIADYSGLARKLPIMAFFMVLFTMSSIGLPGLNGFAGEILILLGLFQRGWAEAPLLLTTELRWFSVLAVVGVVLGAWYMLWLVQRVFFGPLKEPHHNNSNGEHQNNHDEVRDLGFREIAALTPLAILVLWIGLTPGYFLKPIAPAVEAPIAATESPLQEHYAGVTKSPKVQPDLKTEQIVAESR